MSPRSESATEDATDHLETPPSKKARSKKPGIPKDDTKAIRERQEAAIAQILPDTRNHPVLYRGVVQHIERNNLRNGWAKTQLNSTFQHWIKVSPLTARPELEWLLAALAVHASFEPLTLRFLDEVKKRGLKEWAEKQLKKQDPLSSTPIPVEPKTPQQAPHIKTEPGIDSRRQQVTPGGARPGQGNSTVLPSIETGISGTPKRTAPAHPAQPANKRANMQVDQAYVTAEINRLAELHASQRRTVLRDQGTQTDSEIPLQTILASMQEAMGAMKEQSEGLKEQIRLLQEHNMSLLEHDRALADVSGRVRGVSHLRHASNIHHHQIQPQAAEIVALQPVTRQPPTYYYESPRESSNAFRFG
ncbi:hypothetical protein FPHYL_43 [Fusarium phyllophilum]|uniref:Uncharacterized protein n=1 Tax=Fusarium phyllophilum TaxID=47803 RepID=A0A8H5NPY0_9HYPO|nr:hypothetical protein FPHYL_43 [Fusarium phyllophilum]